MLDTSKTVSFKAILCCKSFVNLGWMDFLFVEKLNDIGCPLMLYPNVLLKVVN
jgi:hypothetical protein